MHYLQENGIAVHQAPGDADTVIVSVALDCARQGNIPVAVLAENTDISMAGSTKVLSALFWVFQKSSA